MSNQWWPDRVDLRDLTPLFWAHVLPYGEVKLNMTRRIAALNVAQTVETKCRVELSGRQARTATGGSRPTCHLVPRSLTAPPKRHTGDAWLHVSGLTLEVGSGVAASCLQRSP